jgi:hypothetical protein
MFYSPYEVRTSVDLSVAQSDDTEIGMLRLLIIYLNLQAYVRDGTEWENEPTESTSVSASPVVLLMWRHSMGMIFKSKLKSIIRKGEASTR